MEKEAEVHTDKTQASMKTSPLSNSSSLQTAIYSTLSTAKESTNSKGSKLSAEPVTDKMFELSKGSKVEASRRPQVGEKPTEVRFSQLVDNKDEAKCLLVLCNISERDLHFHLKSSTGSNIVSVPTGNGIIAPHAQVRLVLTWTKATNYKEWKEVPMPRLILTTKYLDVKEDDAELTHTRLVAKLGKKTCTLGNPPVEQLLLDATKGHQMEKLDQEPNASPKPEVNQGQLLADFVNNLSDRGIFVLALILIVCVIIVAGGRC